MRGHHTKRGDEMIHRKLIRPNLSDLKEKMTGPPTAHRPQRKQAPPEQTNAEAFYYLKQMNAKTPMVVVLNDGETGNPVEADGTAATSSPLGLHVTSRYGRFTSLSSSP